MISFLGLMCGVLASLTLGVLIAHGICVSMFKLFRMHAQQVAAARVAPAASLRSVRQG